MVYVALGLVDRLKGQKRKEKLGKAIGVRILGFEEGQWDKADYIDTTFESANERQKSGDHIYGLQEMIDKNMFVQIDSSDSDRVSCVVVAQNSESDYVVASTFGKIVDTNAKEEVIRVKGWYVLEDMYKTRKSKQTKRGATARMMASGLWVSDPKGSLVLNKDHIFEEGAVVDIPEGIEELGKNALWAKGTCYRITEITFPESFKQDLESLGIRKFTRLKRIEWKSKQIEKFPMRWVSGMGSLREIELSGFVKEIDFMMYPGSNSLTVYHKNKGIKCIGSVSAKVKPKK
jgi:hypothetical protein